MFTHEFSYGERYFYLEFIISHLYLVNFLYFNISFSIQFFFFQASIESNTALRSRGWNELVSTQGGLCTLISLGNLYWRHAHMLHFPFVEKYDIIALFSSLLIDNNSQTFPTCRKLLWQTDDSLYPKQYSTITVFKPIIYF